jgi:hypothetical protein
MTGRSKDRLQAGEPSKGSAAGLSTRIVSILDADYSDFAVVACLAVYLTVGPFQHFPPPGWVDPGVYIGYFRNLDTLLSNYGDTYFVNRAPMILVGHALYKVLPLWLANAALSGVWYVGVLLALRALLRPLPPLIRKAALILYGCSPLVVATVARSYADGPAITLSMLSMAAAWRATLGVPSMRGLFIAGFCAVFAVLTQPGSAFVLVPMSLALLLADNRARLVQWFPIALGAGSLGAAFGFLAYLALGLWLTGQVDLSVLADMLVQSSQGLGLKYRESWTAWVFPTTRLFFVWSVLLAGLWTSRASTLANAPMEVQRLFKWALISACGSFALMLASDILVGTSLWQYPFYASYLLPAVYILLAAIIAVWMAEAGANDRLFVLAAALGLSTIATLAVMAATADAPPTAVVFPVLDVVCATAAIAAILAASSVRPVALIIVFLAALCPLASVSADTRHVYRGHAASFGSTYKVLNQAADEIDRATAGRRILFWYDREGFNRAVTHPTDWSTPYGQVYPFRYGPQRTNLNALDTLNAFYLWDRSRLNAQLPRLSRDDLNQIFTGVQNVSIVIISAGPNDAEKAAAALNAYGIRLRNRDNQIIVGESFSLYLNIFDPIA